MRQASLYSAALHIAVITVAYFGVPALLSTPLIEDAPITVDLVSLEEIVKPQIIPKPAKPVSPPPAALPESPEPVAAPAPEPPPPPLVKPKPKSKPKPKPKAKPKPPVRPAKVAPKPKQKPKKLDSMQALLKDLAKRKEELARQNKPALKTEATVKPVAPKSYALAVISQQLRIQKLAAMVKQQLADCWSIPGGVKNVHEIKVGVQIRLNTDGTLRGAPRVVDAARMQSDQSFRVIAESAVRALQNPGCQPLKLPYDQYEIWKDIFFNFDPGEALGQ
jgi:hypothetical protein